jgi:hypothetical protein
MYFFINHDEACSCQTVPQRPSDRDPKGMSLNIMKWEKENCKLLQMKRDVHKEGGPYRMTVDVNK